MKITKIVKPLIFSFFLSSILASPVFASFWSPFTDTVNSGIINTKVATDKSLSNTNIDVTVIDGVAVYSGEVNSKAQLDELIRIAHSVSGIKGIDITRLKVK